MSAPIIDPVTNILAPIVGVAWGGFTPTASGVPTNWKEEAPAFVFTVSGDVLTITGALPVNGDRFILTSSSALPAPLVDGAYYYARDCSGHTCKVAATLDGAAITLTDAGTGTHHAKPTGLPPGLVLSTVNGRISGIPLISCKNSVRLIATNGDGDSASLAIAIGVRDSKVKLDAALPLLCNWFSGEITTPAPFGIPPIMPASDQTDAETPTAVTPLIALKNGDKRPISLQFTAFGQPFAPAITSIVMGIKREDQDPLVARTSGSFKTDGSGSDKRWVIKLDLTAVPSGGVDPLALLNDQSQSGPDMILVYADFFISFDYETESGTVESLNVSTQSFPVALDRALLV